MFIYDKKVIATVLKIFGEIAILILGIRWYWDTKEIEPLTLIVASVIFILTDYILGKEEHLTIESLRKENQKLSEEINTIKNQILNEVTGGDSFGEVMITTIAGDPNNILHRFCLRNLGDYPLQRVSVTVRNQEDVKNNFKGKNGLLSPEDLKLYQTHNIGDIPPHTGTEFGNYFKIKEGEIQYFGFSIVTKYKRFSQLYKFLKMEGKHFTATRLNTVVASGKGKPELLIDKADKGFPGEVDGKIEWIDK